MLGECVFVWMPIAPPPGPSTKVREPPSSPKRADFGTFGRHRYRPFASTRLSSQAFAVCVSWTKLLQDGTAFTDDRADVVGHIEIGSKTAIV